MSMQDIIDWYDDFSKQKRKEICCGVWPFSVPGKFDPFLECCIPHDGSYQESEVLYARGVLEGDELLKDQALEIKQKADMLFIECVRSAYAERSKLTKRFYRWWGENYIDLVLKNSNRIWFGSIGAKIAAYESGETSTVQIALSRTHLYAQEKTICPKAQLPGGLKSGSTVGQMSTPTRPEDISISQVGKYVRKMKGK